MMTAQTAMPRQNGPSSHAPYYPQMAAMQAVIEPPRLMTRAQRPMSRGPLSPTSDPPSPTAPLQPLHNAASSSRAACAGSAAVPQPQLISFAGAPTAARPPPQASAAPPAAAAVTPLQLGWVSVLAKCASLAAVAEDAARFGTPERLEGVLSLANDLFHAYASFRVTRACFFATAAAADAAAQQQLCSPTPTPPTPPPSMAAVSSPPRSPEEPADSAMLVDLASVAEAFAKSHADDGRHAASRALSSASPTPPPPPRRKHRRTSGERRRSADANAGDDVAMPPRRCHMCQTTETPEWRKGPDGLNTLCNACGLQYAKGQRKRSLSLLLN